MLNKEKLLGGVYGLAVGDALGVPVEFQSREYLEKKPVGNQMLGRGTYNQPVGTFSDDTSMTIATLDTMSAGGLSTGAMMEAFAKWYKFGEYTPHGETFDIGGTTRQAIERYLAGEDPESCGLDGEMDNGNGSLMRMLPMIFYIYLKEGAGITPKAVDLIYRLSGLTHANIVSKVSCVYYVYIGIAILLFWEQRGIQWCIKQGVEDVEEFFSDNEPQYVLNYTGMESLKDSLELEEHDIKSTGFVVDSLEASLWCLYTTSSYKEAVLRAVNLGGDTDTIGAITGSLAGLYYGYEEIPKVWVKDLKNKKLINSICDRFYEQHK